MSDNLFVYRIFRLLILFSVFLVVLVTCTPAHAQVNMVQDFYPYRADKVAVTWDADEFSDIAITGIVMGQNENGQLVGYQEDEWFISADDWAQAMTQYLNLPNPGEVDDLVHGAALGFDETGVFKPAAAVTGDIEDLQQVLFDRDIARVYKELNQDISNYTFASVAVPVEGCGGSICQCFHGLFFYDQTLNPSPDFYHEPLEGPYAAVDIEDTGDDEEACTPTRSASYLPIYLPDEAYAAFLPESQFSDESPVGFPDPIPRPLNQNERNNIAKFLDGMDTLAESATEYYESDAYQGYPNFVLYYGYFPGNPDAPEDEGDCEDDFCDGGGSGGPGGGEGDMSELLTLFRDGVGSGSPEADIPSSDEIAEQIQEGLADIPCYGCEFIEDGNGWENTEVGEEVAGLADGFVGLFPEAGSCEQVNLSLVPSMGLTFSIDLCSQIITMLKKLLEFLIAGSSLVACIMIVVPKKQTASKGG